MAVKSIEKKTFNFDWCNKKTKKLGFELMRSIGRVSLILNHCSRLGLEFRVNELGLYCLKILFLVSCFLFLLSSFFFLLSSFFFLLSSFFFLLLSCFLFLVSSFFFLLSIKLKTTHKFVESQVAKAIVGQTIY